MNFLIKSMFTEREDKLNLNNFLISVFKITNEDALLFWEIITNEYRKIIGNFINKISNLTNEDYSVFNVNGWKN